jgi:hypothetical protein
MMILTKIQQAKYILDMHNQEYLYFKSLKDFRSNTKDTSGRLDPRELNVSNKQLKKLTIKISASKELHLHKMENFSAQFMEYLSDSKINCCSFHWLEIEPHNAPSTFNKKLIDLGDKALLIYNWKRFFDIIDSTLGKQKMEFSRKKVIYYNPKEFNGDLTLHHKDQEYSWQNEYRILIAPTNNMPLRIPVPGLKKISCIVDTKRLPELRIEITN